MGGPEEGVMYIISNRIEVPVETRESFEKAFIDSMRDTLAGVPGLHRSTLAMSTPSGPGMTARLGPS
jgi:hypothetical protein